MKPRFLLDENIDPAIQRRLLRRDLTIDVRMVGEPGMPVPGTSDPNILTWIENNYYLLVTQDRRTMPGHLDAHFQAGNHVPEILLIRRSINLARQIEELYLIWEASEFEEYYDKKVYISL